MIYLTLFYLSLALFFSIVTFLCYVDQGNTNGMSISGLIAIFLSYVIVYVAGHFTSICSILDRMG